MQAIVRKCAKSFEGQIHFILKDLDLHFVLISSVVYKYFLVAFLFVWTIEVAVWALFFHLFLLVRSVDKETLSDACSVIPLWGLSQQILCMFLARHGTF